SSAKRLGRLTILGIRNGPFGTAASSGLSQPPYRLFSRPAHATGRGLVTTAPSLRRQYETEHNPRTGRALPERRAAEDQPAEDHAVSVFSRPVPAMACQVRYTMAVITKPTSKV